MINFRDILDGTCVAVGVESRTKDEAFSAAVELVSGSAKFPDKARLLPEVHACASLSSTGIGSGVAVPHALRDCTEA